MTTILLISVLACAAWRVARAALKVAHSVPGSNDDMVFV